MALLMCFVLSTLTIFLYSLSPRKNTSNTSNLLSNTYTMLSCTPTQRNANSSSSKSSILASLLIKKVYKQTLLVLVLFQNSLAQRPTKISKFSWDFVTFITTSFTTFQVLSSCSNAYLRGLRIVRNLALLLTTSGKSSSRRLSSS